MLEGIQVILHKWNINQMVYEMIELNDEMMMNQQHNTTEIIVFFAS